MEWKHHHKFKGKGKYKGKCKWFFFLIELKLFPDCQYSDSWREIPYPSTNNKK